MKVRILRAGNIVNVIEMKISSHESNFDIIRRIEAMQETEDILKIGKLGKVDLGIRTLTHEAGISRVAEDKLLRKCTFNGEEMESITDVEIYETGFVLNEGYTGTNILGGSFNAYLSSFGKRKVYSSPKWSAKVFPTLKALKAFLEKNKNSLEYLVKRNGWQWSMEDANDLSAKDYTESLARMTPKKKTNEELLRKEIESILVEINMVEGESCMPDELPTKITPEVLKNEALRRMKLLDMWENIVNNFRNSGKIYMSEFSGIIYDLNDEAKSAVKEVTDDGKLAYAVIRQTTSIGELYTVLYVSNDTDEWENEIPTRDGWLRGYVYNSSNSCSSELGSVKVRPANGGLTRVA